jgi:ferrochelatase
VSGQARTERIGVLLMAYGTPSTREEIEPYYTDIRRGRPPTPEQLADLVRRYDAIGGTSPLAARTEAQRTALQGALDEQAPGRFEVVLGMKHATPSIEAAVDDLAARGAPSVVAVVLAPHFSGASIGEYLGRAAAAAQARSLALHTIKSWATEPAFVEFLAAAVRQELASLPQDSKVVFTAHSLPVRVIAGGDPYADEVRATASAVAKAVGLPLWSGWSVAWQSAGRTPEPWLGPDILQVIDELAASEHGDGLLVCACGFVADHLEVLYDLDIEAARRAADRGVAFARTACVNDDATVADALARRVIAAAEPPVQVTS